MPVVSFLNTLSYLSLRKLSLKLLTYSGTTCYMFHLPFPFKLSVHLVLMCLLMEVKKNMQTPLNLFLGCHKKGLDPLLSIRHPLLTHEYAMQSRMHVFPVTFKMVQQITV